MLLVMATVMLVNLGTRAAQPFEYVALGDSLGAGVGANRGYVERVYQRVKVERPGATLHNFSSSGATTSDVLRAQLPRLARLRPALITLTVGTNDLTEGTPVEEVTRKLAEIIVKLRATGAAVIVTNLPAVAWAPAIPDAYRAQIDAQVRSANRALRVICDRQRAVVFDLYALSRAEIPRHPEYFSLDGYHPSDEGYERWAEAMWPRIEEALAR